LKQIVNVYDFARKVAVILQTRWNCKWYAL